MSATKTAAFVLKTQDYRDTSVLAHLFTREYGKIRGIIRGVRDARGRYGSTLEPFSLNEILFYRRRRGGDLHQVTQVDLMNLFPEVRDDLERLAYGCYFTELLGELTEVEDPLPGVFDLLCDSLEFLASGASAKRCARIFETKLFDGLGLMPEIKACVVCRNESFDRAYFSVSLGGIRCQACHDSKALSSVSTQSPSLALASIPVSKGTLNFLERVQKSSVKELYHVKVSQEVGEELEKSLTRFVEYHLTNRLKSLVFLDKMGY